MTAVEGDCAGSLLLIDDDEEHLKALQGATANEAARFGIAVETWRPADGERAEEVFHKKVGAHSLLVVTDYDLTRNGRTGLFGVSIVAWCQHLTIPVGDYSRDPRALPREPNLFEFRIPTGDIREAGRRISLIAAGFAEIARAVSSPDALLKARGPADFLAEMLLHPKAAGPFSLYVGRIGSSNSSLIQKIQRRDPTEIPHIVAYVAGHLLFNSILRYSGPILNLETLCAYFGAPPSDAVTLVPLFESARYKGPFAEIGPFFWQDGVDELIDQLAEKHGVEFETSFDSYRRGVAEAVIGVPLSVHPCDRCDGRRGGFWCPFTERAVCERADCSVSSSSWIPQGANLTRVEAGFYEEWAPLLGL